MKSKLWVAVCVLALTAASYGVVIGDFEGGTDGWYANGTNTITPTSVGATTGSGAVQVVDPDGGWGGSIEIALLDQANAAELISAITAPGAKVVADISTMNSDNSIPDWWGDMGLLINTDDDINDAGSYWTSIGWQTVPISWDLGTSTLEWELDAASQAAMAYAAANDLWANVGFITSVGSTYTYYLDNVRIVPEPATLSLLGLGGLAMIRRKR